MGITPGDALGNREAFLGISGNGVFRLGVYVWPVDL